MSQLTPSLAGAQAPPEPRYRPVALRFLDEHLARGGLVVNGHNVLYRVLQMFSEISLLLFPHSLRVHETVMRRVKVLSRQVADAFHTFGENINAHLKSAQRAMEELPDLAVTQERNLHHNLEIWRRRLR